MIRENGAWGSGPDLDGQPQLLREGAEFEADVSDPSLLEGLEQVASGAGRLVMPVFVLSQGVIDLAVADVRLAVLRERVAEDTQHQCHAEQNEQGTCAQASGDLGMLGALGHRQSLIPTALRIRLFPFVVYERPPVMWASRNTRPNSPRLRKSWPNMALVRSQKKIGPMS